MAAIRELYLISLFLLFSQISGQWSGNATIKQCGSSDLTITFNFSLGGEGFLERYWYLDSTAKKIAVLNSTGFLTVEPPYISRLTLSGTSGITLANANRSDSGSYLFVFFTDTTFTFLTAITTVIINEKPNKLCKPITTNYINSITCKIPAACPVKDSIQARWNDGSIEELKCPSAITKSTCCAIGDPVTNCYNESLCTDDECKATTADITSTTASTANITTANISSTTTASTANESEMNKLQLVIIIIVSAAVIVLVTVIIIICCRKRKKGQTNHKAHHAIARNGPNSTNEQNEFHYVTNTSQVDSCLDVSKVPETKSDKGNSNAQIQSTTHI